jgi:hypothetical protein
MSPFLPDSLRVIRHDAESIDFPQGRNPVAGRIFPFSTYAMH